MNIFGKMMGGAAGLILGGPLGALLGVAAGHAVDRLSRPAAERADLRATAKQAAFTVGVIALGAKMAKADGRVTRDEVAAFRQVFRVPREQEALVGRIFNAARRDAGGFEPYARQIARMFKDEPAVLEELLRALFHIAKADGVVHQVEIDFVAKVAAIFGLSEAEFERIREASIGPNQGDPYRILGVPRDADMDTVKAAYRRLIREHHPDRLIAQGLPEESVDLATETLARINGAYETIEQERRAPVG